jgi:hypothetical protein
MAHGVVFVLCSGIPGEMLPQEMGCGSGMSCCDDCVTGRSVVSGNRSTSFCWTGWRVTDRLSTGHGQSWTEVRSGQFLGAPDAAESK